MSRTMRSHSTSTSRNTGSCAISSRPMPHHCGPIPEKTKASRGGCGSAEPVARPGASSPATCCPKPGGDLLAGCRRRPPGDGGGASGVRRRCGRRRRARGRPAPTRRSAQAAAAALSACGLARRHDDQVGGPGRPRARAARVPAAPRRIAWAFVPPKPNELTPATGGPGPPGQGSVLGRRRAGRARRRGSPGSAPRGGASAGSPVLERERGLDEPRDAGRRLQVARGSPSPSR